MKKGLDSFEFRKLYASAGGENGESEKRGLVDRDETMSGIFAIGAVTKWPQ